MTAARRVLLTGGAGFIGSHLIERLPADTEITLFDNLHRNALAYLGPLADRVRLVRGDVLDAAALAAAAAGQDAVIHLAAIAGTRSVGRDPALTMRVNLVGTLNCLEAAASAGVRRLIAFSTSEVYGRHANEVTEDQPTPIPAADDDRWGYAASKLAAEHAALAFHRAGRLETLVLRPFNVYGPRQVGEGAIGDMVAAAVTGGPIVVKGDGTQVRSWCFVGDFADAAIAALTRPEAAGLIFNIGNADATVSVNDLAATVARLAGGVSVTHVAATGPDVQHRHPSIERARRILGFDPRVGLEEGISRTLAWRRALSA